MIGSGPLGRILQADVKEYKASPQQVTATVTATTAPTTKAPAATQYTGTYLRQVKIIQSDSISYLYRYSKFSNKKSDCSTIDSIETTNSTLLFNYWISCWWITQVWFEMKT